MVAVDFEVDFAEMCPQLITLVERLSADHFLTIVIYFFTDTRPIFGLLYVSHDYECRAAPDPQTAPHIHIAPQPSLYTALPDPFPPPVPPHWWQADQCCLQLRLDLLFFFFAGLGGLAKRRGLITFTRDMRGTGIVTAKLGAMFVVPVVTCVPQRKSFTSSCVGKLWTGNLCNLIEVIL